MFSQLKPVSTSGVIDVMNKAMELGFHYGNPEWSNLGQGSPETGEIEGDIDRVTSIATDEISMGYAPIGGVKALREAVADLYNDLYRFDKESKYTWENVCISGGGRLGIARALAALNQVRLGHFVPDYASYEQLLETFKTFTPVEIELPEADNFYIDPGKLRSEIQQKKLDALLISNPCNPTAQHIRGQELRDWVQIARDENCLMIMDEFYSHYVYGDAQDATHHMVSSARYIDDVNSDPIVISEGLTKNWRYPGFRICWTVGPKDLIAAIASVASSMDGGPSHPLQVAALPLLETGTVMKKTTVLHELFQKKAELVIDGLTEAGITFPIPPRGSFYCWGCLDSLP